MTPSQFVFASGDIVVSYAATAGPPAVFISAGVLDCVGVVAADDTIATIDLLVERDVGDLNTLELLEPFFDFTGVGRWGEIPIARPSSGG